MNDSTLQSQQRRERLLSALASLKIRYEQLFNEPAQPRLQAWLSAKVEEEKSQAIKSSLSHFETEEFIELLALVSEPTPEQKRNDEMAKQLAQTVNEPVKKKVRLGR